MSTETDPRISTVAKILEDQIVPYDAWWNLTPEELAEDIVKALEEMAA